jgi:hypothetical protein
MTVITFSEVSVPEPLGPDKVLDSLVTLNVLVLLKGERLSSPLLNGSTRAFHVGVRRHQTVLISGNNCIVCLEVYERCVCLRYIEAQLEPQGKSGWKMAGKNHPLLLHDSPSFWACYCHRASWLAIAARFSSLPSSSGLACRRLASWLAVAARLSGLPSLLAPGFVFSRLPGPPS